MKILAKQAHRYRAHVHLGLFEQVVSDADLKSRFEAVGLVNVSVVGEGRERWAFGTWPGEDLTVDLPSQIVAVEDVT